MAGGWIKVHRCFDQSEAAHFPPCTREVWFYLLRNVNHADNGKYRRGNGFFALEDIQEDLSWSVGYRVEKYSKPQLTKALRRLKNALMIETARATRGIYVTVLNYDKYQGIHDGEGNDEGNETMPRGKCEGMHLEQEEKKKENTYCENTAPGGAARTRKPSFNQADFDRFWNAFADKRGKAGAVKSWKAIKNLSPELVEQIVAGAKAYAGQRQSLIAKGQTPKMAQGWLSDRRWEDEIESTALKTCQTCTHYGTPCQGKDETCSTYEAAA